MTHGLDLLVVAGVVVLAALWLVRRWRRTLRRLKTPNESGGGCPGCSGCAGCPGCGPLRPGEGSPSGRPAACHEKPTIPRDDASDTPPRPPRRPA